MSDRHTQKNPKFNIGTLVYCADQNFPGPWVVDFQMPWCEFGKGEWRYQCARPEGWKNRAIRIGRRIIRAPLRMTASEDELYLKKLQVDLGAKSRRPVRRTMRFQKSEGGILIP